MKKETWFPINGLAYAREVSLAALPGADGRYPVTETFSDGLGRATNSLRAVWFNGTRDGAYTPLATLTAQSGDMADSFTYRFSTKPFGTGTGIPPEARHHGCDENACSAGKQACAERGRMASLQTGRLQL